MTSRRTRARRLSALAGVGLALIGAVMCSIPASAGEAENAGEALVVAGQGVTRRVTKGGSATEFSLRLPAGASCPGDSANDGYRVQSYMVPATVAPGSVEYDGLGPTPNVYGVWATFRQPLYDTATRPFASAGTAEAWAPGQPGAIVNIPTFSFAVYRPGELPPGRYNVGIACTTQAGPARYWNTELAVELAPQDTPAGVVWAVATPSGSAGSSRSLALPAIVAVVVAGALALLLTARRRA